MEAKKIRGICALIIAFEIGLYIGSYLGQVFKSHAQGLPLAVGEAQKFYDKICGPKAFLYGLRRVAQDGDNEFYMFQIKAPAEKSIVTVDLRCNPPRVEIDNATNHNFLGEWKF